MCLNFEKFKKDRGFAAFLMVILVLSIMIGIGASIINLTLGQQRISRNVVKSTQSYYAAESGVEDAMLRLKKAENLPAVYGFSVGEAWVTTTVTDEVGGIKKILGQGDDLDRIRKVQARCSIASEGISFFYGVQAGDGGIVMANNSKIHGNVFSNGDIGNDKGYIDNDVIISGHHRLNIGGGEVGGKALVYDCIAGTITGKLTYVNSNSCTLKDGVEQQAEEIDSVPLPISQDEINEWMAEAAKGGVTTTDVTISGTKNLGPIQIGTSAAPKNLIVNGTLNITGTIYVTGNITFNGTTRLDSAYGSDSGIILADGKILVENGAVISGSGQLGSYTLVLSTNSSLNPANPAINVRNNAGGSIFYTTGGLIFLKNNMSAREITGYKIQIENNAEIWYETGLSDLRFSSGPGGSWLIDSWQEVE